MTERIGRALPPPSGRAPVMNIAPRDVARLDDEAHTCQQMYTDCFVRREQRHWALRYSQGQMLSLPRKLIEPMAVAFEGGNTRSEAMQQFVSQGAWSNEEVLTIRRRAVAETQGRADGVVILDGCDFPKQSADSVGAARQYCGPLGKLANCQASVVLAYASELGAALLDRRRYLPREWLETGYRQMNQLRARTTSRSPVFRLLLVGLAFFLVKLYIALRRALLVGGLPPAEPGTGLALSVDRLTAAFRQSIELLLGSHRSLPRRQPVAVS